MVDQSSFGFDFDPKPDDEGTGFGPLTSKPAAPATPVASASPDFGFSLVHADDFEAAAKAREEQVKKVVSTALRSAADEAAQARMQGLRALVMPLLTNLAKDPDREWIHWPNRAQRIEDFVKKMDAYING